MPRAVLLALGLTTILALVGCGDDRDQTPIVTLYTSVDPAYAEPIVDAFEAKHDVEVRLVTDTEATKSIGLVERLRAEADRPVCDVWWANEPFRTVSLADEGVFASYRPAEAADIREGLVDPDARWHGNGLRLRVLAFAEGVEPVATLQALARSERRVVIARPTAGTTGSHVAALYLALGDEQADALFKDLHAAGVRIVAGNSYAAEAVARGDADIALTDNDDVAAARKRLDPDPAQHRGRSAGWGPRHLGDSDGGGSGKPRAR